MLGGEDGGECDTGRGLQQIRQVLAADQAGVIGDEADALAGEQGEVLGGGDVGAGQYGIGRGLAQGRRRAEQRTEECKEQD